ERAPRPADQDRLEARRVQVPDGVQGVLLGAAQVQTRDDVDDLDPAAVVLRRAHFLGFQCGLIGRPRPALRTTLTGLGLGCRSSTVSVGKYTRRMSRQS